MKKYIVQENLQSCMGSTPSYRFMNEKELKNVRSFGDFIRVFELASPRPVSKKKLKEFGVPFLQKTK